MSFPIPWDLVKDWLLVFTSGLAGVLLTVLVSWLLFKEDIEVTKKIAQVELTRDLTKEFNQKDSIYKQLEKAINECKYLYLDSGGDYSWEQINEYLNFFETLGFYERQKVLDTQFINQVFGSVIIETYEHPEIKRYIKEMQETAPRVFVNFELLAQKIKRIRKTYSEHIRGVFFERCKQNTAVPASR